MMQEAQEKGRTLIQPCSEPGEETGADSQHGGHSSCPCSGRSHTLPGSAQPPREVGGGGVAGSPATQEGGDRAQRSRTVL